MKKWLLILFVMLGGLFAQEVSAQATTDSQLAAHYYQQGEFDKAAMYYKRLYDRDHSTFHYNYYLRCLFEIEDFEAAEKVVKFHARLNPNDYQIKVDLGIVYSKQGNEKLAQKTYKKLVGRVLPLLRIDSRTGTGLCGNKGVFACTRNVQKRRVLNARRLSFQH